MTEYESKYESRFFYITDDNLRKHMWDAMEFIADLLFVSNNFPESNKNYFYKTCILYTASLIESHIHYCVLENWFEEYQSKIFTYKNIKELHICDDGFKIMSWKREKEKISINWNIDFNILNTFAYKTAKIYNEDMFKSIDKIRKLRNQIHLMKLEDLDRKYSKKQLDDIFEISRDLFKTIENNLSN